MAWEVRLELKLMTKIASLMCLPVGEMAWEVRLELKLLFPLSQRQGF